MKALLQTRLSENADASVYGDMSVFELGEFEAPKAPPTPTDVIIKVHVAALNPVDVKRSFLPFDKDFPLAVGYDVAGTVHAVGSEVTKFSVGDKVYGDIIADTLGPRKWGSIAEYAVSPASVLDKIPDGVTFEQAAGIPLVAMTAIQALRLAGTKEGDKVYVPAGAGGVGVHLIQIAKNLFKAGEVATTCSAAKVDFVKQYGADKVIDYKTQNAAEELAGWADVVIDTTSEYESAKKILKQGKKVVSITPPTPDDITPCLIQPSGDDMATVSKLLSEGKLEVVIDSVHKMSEVLQAVERQGSGRAKGKIVVKVA